MLPIVASSQALEHAFTLLAIAKDPKAAEEYLTKFAEAGKAHDDRVAELRARENALAQKVLDAAAAEKIHETNVADHLAKVAEAQRGWIDLEAQRQAFAAERQKALDVVAAEKAQLEAGRRELAGQMVSHNQAVASVAAREMAADQRHAAAATREEALAKAEAQLTARRDKLAKALSA